MEENDFLKLIDSSIDFLNDNSQFLLNRHEDQVTGYCFEDGFEKLLFIGTLDFTGEVLVLRFNRAVSSENVSDFTRELLETDVDFFVGADIIENSGDLLFADHDKNFNETYIKNEYIWINLLKTLKTFNIVKVRFE